MKIQLSSVSSNYFKKRLYKSTDFKLSGAAPFTTLGKTNIVHIVSLGSTDCATYLRGAAKSY